MNARIKVTCPYCKTEQEVWAKVGYTGTNGKTIVFCDNEDVDGCGEEFIIEPLVTVTANVMAIVPVNDKKWTGAAKEQQA